MLEDTPGSEPTTDTTTGTAPDTAPEGAPTDAPAKKAAAKKAAKKAPAKKTAKKAPAKKIAANKVPPADAPDETAAPAKKAPAKKTAKKAPAKKAAAKKAAAKKTAPTEPTEGDQDAGTVPLFQAPDAGAAPARKRPAKKAAAKAESAPEAAPVEQSATAESGHAGSRDAGSRDAATGDDESGHDESGDAESGEGGARRRRRRGGRRRRKSGGEGEGSSSDQGGEDADAPEADDQAGQEAQQGQATSQAKQGQGKQGQGKQGQGKQGQGKQGQAKQGQAKQGQKKQGQKQGQQDQDEQDGESSTSRRRRRRRRAGEDPGQAEDDPQNTVTRVRKTRSPEDGITALAGSTRLEAKKQRRREGREAGRRRAPIVSEAEFLARRESVERVMAIRQRDDLTQIAVLEDKVLVEHYVARESQTSLIGNVYLGRVQNVLPSMEAAFIDIGKGRNAVLYAGEVNWSALGHKDGQPRKIESVLSSGQSILVQVTKDPVGHKGARLTSQVSLAGRFLVYVPDGTNSGISRKLPDTERSRLKTLLKEIVPDGAGVIVRTAAEGASEDELTRDVERLTARWADIDKKAKGSSPQLLYGEPDLMLKVVRDLFTEDFAKLVVQGADAWDTVHGYVTHVAPDLLERLAKHDDSSADLFATYRIEEQIHKGLDRKVWLPSGGSLIIDRTEAMTVVDVNTGKFTGSGGNLEETVTKNNLEAAEEMVRQLRLRDIGGIIVVDFIDMVLESNRDLVLRRLVECLGRDRTRHQVAEVTSLGLVQMTRKRIGTGLLEAFSEPCEHCAGRGLVVADVPIEPKKETEARRGARRSRGGRGRGEDTGGQSGNGQGKSPSPKDVAAMARPHQDDAEVSEPTPEEIEPQDQPAAPAEPEQPDTAEDQPQLEPAAEEPAAEEPPAEPAAPKVVTRTRRRSARRPAAEEPVAEEPVAEEPVAEEPVAEEPVVEEPVVEEPVVEEPVVEEPVVEEPAVEELPVEPVAPKVVTRTRRRSASRPAGPPATVPPATVPSMSEVEPPGVVGQPAVDGVVEPGTADTEVGGKPVVEHVPIKKRGSRKR